MSNATPTTHGEPLLNELDPSDPAVLALTTPKDVTPLPSVPRSGGGLR